MRVARPLLSALAAPGGPTPLLLLRGGNAAPGAREFFDRALTVVNCGSGLLLLCGCALALINSASLLLNKLFRGSLPFVGGFAQSIDKNEVKVDGLSGIKGVITVGRIRLQLGSLIMLSLTLLVAADVIDTIVMPVDEYTLEGLAKLAVVATIRTGLSFFLGKEMKEVEEDLEDFYNTRIIV